MLRSDTIESSPRSTFLGLQIRLERQVKLRKAKFVFTAKTANPGARILYSKL